MKIVEFKDYDNQTTPLSAYNLNRLQQNLITTKYQMTFSSAVSGGSTITLPCYYQVGQDTLDVYLNSELLKKASTKDSEGHYYEVGNSDTKSNQIKITSDWSIASGDVLNLIVRGTTDSYDQNLSPDKATQLADEISANKEEITALQTENSRLKGITNALPKISGEDTSLTLTNTANAPLSDIILKGNTSQNTTTGKNLLKFEKISRNGISFDNNTINIVNPTSYLYNDSNVINDTSLSGQKISIAVLINGVFSSSSPDFSFIINTNKSNYKYQYIINNQITNYDNSKTVGIINLGSDEVISQTYIYIPDNSITGTNLTLQVMILKGEYTVDTIPPFEPYTNGASPNPEYPQEIHCVKGNNVVTISNGNVLPNNLSDGTMNGITYTINGDKSINLSGTATSRVEPKLYDGAGYTIPAGVYKNTTAYNIIGYAGTMEYLVFNANVSTNLTKDVTFKQLYFKIESGATVNETIYPQIILSSKTDTSYVPHKEQVYELDLGNIELCKIGDYQDYFYQSGSKWYLHKEINKITSYNGETITTSYISTTGKLSTGAKVYYVVTPTDTKITDTTLISQLNELEKAVSYDDTTNISQTNANLPFIINAEAFKKIS